MEELKVETKTRKKQTPTYTEPKEQNQNYDTVKESGIRVKKVVFFKTVTSWTGEPEYSFYADGANRKSRIADMWYTPWGLFCEQAKEYKVIVPLTNVSFIEPA